MAESKTSSTNAEQLITEHLDIWTTAIEQKSSSGRGSSKKFSLHGIKKLRELILELAVRGKLVPQDQNDEPASVLLERIAAEKAQLVKDKKIKKLKALPEISEDEKLLSLPQGWTWGRLNDIYDVRDGTHNTPKYQDSGYPLVTSKNLSSGELKLDGAKFISEEDHFEISLRSKVDREDILFAMIGSIGNAVLVKTDTDFSIKNVALFKYYLRELSCPNYLLYFLSFAEVQFKLEASGAVQSFVSLGKVRSFVMPLPPLKEQQRIVAKVDELMSLCDALEAQTENSITAHQTLVEVLLEALLKAPEQTATPEQATAQFQQNWQRLSEHFDTLFPTTASIDTLKQTILQLAVMGKLVPQNPNDEPAAKLLERIAAEKAQLIKDKKIKKQKPLPEITDEEKPFELPKGWEWVNLASLITLMDAGWSPACPPEASPNNDTWGVLKTTAVQNMEYREYENKTLSEAKEPKPQYEVKVGDILITRAGPKNRVGVSCLVQETRPKLMISDKIIRFHLLEVGMSERFISLCLNAGVTAAFLESAKSGMAESQMNISQDKLKAAPIPLAPIKEQHSIITKVDELMALCDQLKARLIDAQTTKLHLTDAIVEQAL